MLSLTNTNDFKDLLREIFGVDDRYIVPLNEGGIVPFFNKEETRNTYIGYRIIAKEPYARAYLQDEQYQLPIKIYFRLSFVGEKGEQYATDTLFWPDRRDITDAFEKRHAQLNYSERAVISKGVKEPGFNDRQAWVIDMVCQTHLCVPVEYGPWNVGDGKIPVKEPDEDWFAPSPSDGKIRIGG